MATNIDRWTIQIADRARTAQRDFTETLVEIGDLLAKVRAELPHGAWLKLVGAYRRRLVGLLRATTVLIARSGDLPQGILKQLRDALSEIAAQLGVRRRLARAGP